MKRIALLSAFALICSQHAFAQLPNGSQAPNFTVTDVNGQTYTLYTLLDQGYTVYLDFFATWCGPCWNYHNQHAFEDIWQQYGPPGTDQAFCFQIEGDPNTNTACIFGPSGCNNSTWGDWTDGVSYPTVDNAAVADLYNINYYPTIYMVCPADRKVYVVGQQNATGLWQKRTTYCNALAVDIDLNSVNHVYCYGQSTGSIDITPSGSAPPYTYLWSNGAQGQDLMNIPAGNYSCTVTSSSGVTGTIGPIEVEQPPSPVSIQLIETTPVGCNGYTGSITVEASGGWANDYDYVWSNGLTGPTITAYTPGNYMVTVTDIVNCTKTLVVPMAQPAYPAAMISPSPVITCLTPVVQLNATQSSTGPEFTYDWLASNGGNIVSGANSLTPTVNAAGTYTLVVTNTANNCTSYASTVVLANNTLPTADAGPNATLNCLSATDTLQGSGSQGTAFQAIWTGPGIVSGDSTFTPVVDEAGAYVLKVTNTLNGCIKTDTAMVVADTLPPVLTLQTPEHLNCYNDTVVLLTTGSSQGAPFVYAWTGPGGFGSNEQHPLVDTAGTYILEISNTENGCSSNDTTEVLSFAAPTVGIDSVIAITCFGGSGGGLLAETTGGFGPITFVWNTGDSTHTVLNLSAGPYGVTVTDADACTAALTYTLGQPEQLVASALSSHETGFQTNDGAVSADASGGVAPFAFLWSNGVSGQSQSNLPPGAYTVTVTDANNCSSQKTVNVNAYNCLLSVELAVQHNTCFGAADGALATGVAGGTGPFSFVWSTGDTTAGIQNLAPGIYSVTTTDAAGCPNVSDAQVVQPPVLLPAAAGVQHPVCPDDPSGAINVAPGGGTSPYYYSWNTGENTPSIDQLSAGDYQLTITDANGCTHVSGYLVAPTDGEKPVVEARDATVYLDDTGNHTLAVSDVQAAFSDNCSVASWWFFPLTTVTCQHVGIMPVELNARDGNGNVGSRIIQLTVADNTPPAAVCPDNLTVQACSDSTVVQFPQPGASDACTPFPEIRVERLSGLDNNAHFPVGATEQVYQFSDKSGNVSTCSFTINVLAPVVVTAVETTPAKDGQADGSIHVNVTGGVQPYLFSWTRNGETVGHTQNLENVPAGEYVLQITDAHGCVIRTDVIELGSLLAAAEPGWAEGLRIQPNPNAGKAQVLFGQIPAGEVLMRATDGLGRLVWEGRFARPQSVWMDLSSSPEGAYYLHIFHENEQVTRKLIIRY
ncbi:MAG: HYR domain-containing protein [Saprospiraceae bacterium]|nr:HYR domain-containing protein [Saprospiraceae bacterium]